MTLETERSAIESRFATQWAASAYSALKVGYDGQKFEFVANTTSVRMRIADGAAEQISFGSPGTNLIRNVGVILFQIATPGGVGTATLRPIEETIMGFFRNVTFGGVRCRVPYVIGREDEPPFLLSTIACPFERDEYNG
ncbi:hypothetical protein SJ05684_c10700 [Sinorhizobium sojae CCBAU 05684]|uniref:Uncharacterized protein n=1 Tax=Sinorhizobium sojae CCBAU 05684 TaxID=716928 RepID=A0A249PA02_9HYPH|nr:hypothetical protein [Sinorhizobium sojae]ASY62527.1 hypothetical protein SJ05684_c10700 [Sinorhizobium sojae CCBAU 05684]